MDLINKMLHKVSLLVISLFQGKGEFPGQKILAHFPRFQHEQCCQTQNLPQATPTQIFQELSCVQWDSSSKNRDGYGVEIYLSLYLSTLLGVN